MATITIEQARENIRQIGKGDQVAFKDSKGKIRIGTVRLKEINCGKSGCTRCPHKIYAYAQYRIGKKVTEKYLGVARGVL